MDAFENVSARGVRARVRTRATRLAAIAAALACVSCLWTPASAETAETYHGVFRIRRVDENVAKPRVVLLATKVEGGPVVSLLLPEKDPDGKVDMGVLRSSWPGSLLEVTCTNTAGAPTVSALKAYESKWGEEEDGVFVYRGRGEGKLGRVATVSVELTRYLQPATVLVPLTRGKDGNQAPDAEMLKTLEGIQAGDLVKFETRRVGDQLVLRSIEYFEPYRQVSFLRILRQKVGDKELPAVEVSEGDETLPLLLDPDGKDYSKMTAVLGKCRLGSNLLIRSSKDDKGNWLTAVKPMPGPPGGGGRVDGGGGRPTGGGGLPTPPRGPGRRPGRGR